MRIHALLLAALLALSGCAAGGSQASKAASDPAPQEPAAVETVAVVSATPAPTPQQPVTCPECGEPVTDVVLSGVSESGREQTECSRYAYGYDVVIQKEYTYQCVHTDCPALQQNELVKDCVFIYRETCEVVDCHGHSYIG